MLRMFGREPLTHVLTTTWAVSVAAVFFISLDAYVYLGTNHWYTRPVYWTLLTLIVSLPLLAKRFGQAIPIRLLRSPIGHWSLGFLVLSAIYLVLFPRSQAATAVMFQHLHFVVLFWLFVLVFSAAQREVIITLAACTVGAALLNWLEFFHPLATNAFDCRAVGTYLNPNSAAYALVFGMLAGLQAVRDQARSWFVIAVGISILPTYSRSGMISYAVAMLALLASGTINWRRLMLPAFVGTTTVALLFSLALMNVGGRRDCVSHLVTDRAKVIFAFSAGSSSVKSVVVPPDFVGHQAVAEKGEPAGVESVVLSPDSVLPDFSTQERIFLLQNAFSAYRANWLFGEGLGATWALSKGQRTHNMYLEKAIEMGGIGFLLWPSFLFLLMFSCQGQSRKLAWTLLSCSLVLGLFSHNLFESRQLAIAAALLLVMSREKQPG